MNKVKASEVTLKFNVPLDESLSDFVDFPGIAHFSVEKDGGKSSVIIKFGSTEVAQYFIASFKKLDISKPLGGNELRRATG